MTDVTNSTRFDSTSAAGAMLGRLAREPVLVGCMLAGLGTSTTYAAPFEIPWRSQPVEPTTAGAITRSEQPADAITHSEQPAGAAIGELRRLSGLTWDQLANMLHVSRRALHFWASGTTTISSNNEARLLRILAILRELDHGTASANRTALLGGVVDTDGSILFDILAKGDFDRARVLVGPPDGRRVSPPKLSKEAQAARSPRPPDELVGALQNRTHPTSGRLLAAVPITIPVKK